MKIQQTLPQNEEFFSRYAALIPTLYKFGFLAQTVQALTEMSIVYAVIYSRAVEFSPQNAVTISAAGAILLPLVLAVGLRKFLTFSVRAILNKHFTGLDGWMTALIFAITAALLLSSGSLSFHGAKDMIEIASPPPAQSGTDKADNRRTDEESRTLSKFSRDSALVAANFSAKIQATRSKYQAQIRETQLTTSRAKAQSERAAGWGKIEGLKAEMSAALASIQATKADSLSALFSARERRLSDVLSDHKKATDKVETANTENLQKFQTRTNKYGGLLAYFTLFCLGFAALTITLYEMHCKGSGIKPVALPNQYHFSQGVFEELTNALSDKFQYHSRNAIRAIERSTPAPPMPAPPPTLYELGEMRPYRLKIETPAPVLPKIPNTPSNLPHNQTPPQFADTTPAGGADALKAVILAHLDAARKLAEASLFEAAKEQEIKAEDVIIIYLGESATPDAVEAFKNAAIAYLNGKGANPFEAGKRTVIKGFQRNEEQEAPAGKYAFNAMRYNAGSGDNGGGKVILNCQQCGGQFERRTTFQKFCTEACRVKAWEAKTGRPLKKGTSKT